MIPLASHSHPPLRRTTMPGARLAAFAAIWIVAITTACPVVAAGALRGANCVMRPPPPGLGRADHGEALRRRPAFSLPRLPALSPQFAPAIDRAPARMHIPVVLMDFTDQPASMTPAGIYAREFGVGASASVRNYYREVSGGHFDLEGEVFDWVHSDRRRIYYTFGQSGFAVCGSALATPYDHNSWGAIHEAIDLADAAIDFSRFDADGDHVVDAVIFVFAGQGAEERDELTAGEFLWSHKFDLRQCTGASCGSYCPAVPGTGLMTNDGVAIGPYLVLPDIGEVGVWCHEFGHILGLPDLYYGNASSPTGFTDPIGFFDLMDLGAWSSEPVDNPDDAVPGSSPSHLSAWSKYTLGWLNESADLTPGGGAATFEVTIQPAERVTENEPAAVRLLANPGGANWTPEGQGSGRYFLIENRQNLGFDRGLFTPIGGFNPWPSLASRADIGGLLVTFVDETRRTDGLDNRDAAHPLITVLQASGDIPEPDGTLPGFGDSLDVWPRRGAVPGEFSAATAPPSVAYDTELASVLVNDIRWNADGSYTMTVNTPGSSALAPAGSETLPGSAVAYAFPNPWRGSGGPVYIHFAPRSGPAASLRARILSTAGTVVRTLDAGNEVDTAGSQAVWDLADDSGRPVASGLYIFVIEAGGEHAAGKIAIMH